MSLAVRVIPCLDVDAGRVVKGVNFEGLRDAGDPVELATRYNAEGADELIFLDITASSGGRATMIDVVRRTADAVFIPLTVGGGVRSIDDVRRLLNAGADKVSINTAAVKKPEFVREAANKFGSQCIVVGIDARAGQVSLAGWTESSGVDVADAAAELTRRGVVRFLFTPIEVDGTMEGPNIPELIRVAGATDATVIASGGVGNLRHLENLAQRAPSNVEGVIVGKALFEGRFSVAEAVAALRGGSAGSSEFIRDGAGDE